MELSDRKLNMHPQAHNLLFQSYQPVKHIFLDVLGLLEIDYIAIMLLTPHNEWLLFSSRPSIESNLIEKNLWPFDASFSHEFLLQGQARLWPELYHDQHKDILYFYKQKVPEFSMGIAVPATFNDYRVVYSFALKSTDVRIHQKVANKADTLIGMGKYCLQKIIRIITLPAQSQHIPTPLRLVINH